MIGAVESALGDSHVCFRMSGNNTDVDRGGSGDSGGDRGGSARITAQPHNGHRHDYGSRIASAPITSERVRLSGASTSAAYSAAPAVAEAAGRRRRRRRGLAAPSSSEFSAAVAAGCRRGSCGGTGSGGRRGVGRSAGAGAATGPVAAGSGLLFVAVRVGRLRRVCFSVAALSVACLLRCGLGLANSALGIGRNGQLFVEVRRAGVGLDRVGGFRGSVPCR